jgi:PAS domain S-box-containing protein
VGPSGGETQRLTADAARVAVGTLVAELGPSPPPGRLREALRHILVDPTLEVGYWLSDLPGFVDIDGNRFDPAAAEAATYVHGVDGRIGVLTHRAVAAEDASLVEGIASAARLVLENERLHAELRARLVELEDRRFFTDLVVDNAPVYIAVVDADGVLAGGINQTLLEVLGVSHRDAVAGRAFWEVISVAEEADEARERLALVAAGRALGVQEARIRSASGEPRIVEWRDTILPDRRGRLKWIVRAGLDVTERKAQEAELRRLADEQSALRRVATVVAEQATLDELVRTATREVAQLLGGHTAAVMRIEGTGVRVVGSWTAAGVPAMPPERFFDLDGVESATASALQTREPQRLTDLDPAARGPVWAAYGIASAISAPIIVDGEVWGAITTTRDATAEPFLPRAEEGLADMAALVAQALANVAARAELNASRARIVQAGDEARRRLERNLHDGAQQRLVSLSIALRLADAHLGKSPETARGILRAASEDLAGALAELRELARGLHPAVLTDRGLGPALQVLADRSPVPVEVENRLEDRLPTAVEAAAYYVVSEALANVVKHAEASSAAVRLHRVDGTAHVEVIDDGVGGAVASAGSGLRGLADRVEALGGRLRVAAGEPTGTRVAAEIPCR